ncbi:Ribosome assembly protein 1 [Cyberlindnera fabianii]|uniref:Ribosome assembly protein 1 n=1 Tax=Cyberlindnera fabianii TaxID=36022 RepID=A0A1V2LAR6_CYBFA|nr:Ribosome assembly protein 1 [Cyberlindnera fabianii]
MKVTPETLLQLQKQPESIRNICILAHVDHGKTSLSDSLLASNGIISHRLAGKVRYLDSRPDEQLRGITMESSAISLYFRVLHKQEDGSVLAKEHLINLIDSPGHIDFSSEVSTASRLCDGAVVLVDVVEGVCSQTVTVLRQCWMDKLKPVLVLNKIDRLITELKLSPSEAYQHLQKVIEQVNVVIGSFFSGDRMAADLAYRENMEKSGEKVEFVESDDKDLYFDPAQNNVIFASAVDGWGFNIGQFARIMENLYGFKREAIQKCLWGDFYMDPKTKKVLTSKGLKGRSLKPLFVQFVLDSIWTIYQNTVIEKDQEKLEKIISKLGIKVLPRDLRSKDNKNLLTQVLGQWLPVSSAVLLTVTDKLPSPLTSQQERIPTILESAPNHELIDPTLRTAMLACDNTGPCSAYVSKILSIPEDELPRNTRSKLTVDEIMERGKKARELAAKAAEQAKILENGGSVDEVDELADEFKAKVVTKDPFDMFEYEEEEEEEEIELKKEELIGFARVYSGTLKVGQELTVLEPKYDPTEPTKHIQTAVISELYLLMGKELVPLDEVPSGNIAGIGGLAGKLLKNGTLIEPGVTGVNLAGVSLAAPPIVRVALEPMNPTQMDQLERGLELLNLADPCVQTFLDDSGEHILATAGELHLERCLKDLKERFAGIEIQVSEPVIPYRETFIRTSEMNPPKKPELGRGVSEFELGNLSIKLRALPLPQKVVEFLQENQRSIRSFAIAAKKRHEETEEDDKEEDGDIDATSNTIMDIATFKKRLQHLFSEDDKYREVWADIVDRVSAFGPKRVGPNILFDSQKESIARLFSTSDAQRLRFENSIINGFQLSTQNGPLAHEPVHGMAVILEDVVEKSEDEESTPVPNLLGRLITTTRDHIHQCFLDWSPRMMLATYSCDIQASAEVLGKVYAVVQKRRGHIVSEEMKEGTPFFQIVAKLPVVEAFGFSEDIRKRTSGAAQPQLVFAGYEAIDEDPFWVPTTEEELEHQGEWAERENIARKYMNAIRKRKGLFVEEKVVQNAEKQRTLKRN